MTYQLLFRVNAGIEQGLGHLMRCLALAQSAELQGMESHFWVNSEALELCHNRNDWVGELYPVDSQASELKELAQIAQFSQRHAIDAIVIDGYSFSQSYRKALKSIGLPVICFDDTNTSGALWADFIINGAGNAPLLNYRQSNPHAALCLGASYRVMRSEFAKVEPTPFKQRNELLITFGGSDPKGLTLPVLRKLEQNKFDGLVSVVTGAANIQVQEVEDFAKKSDLHVQHEHDCQFMAKKMNSARLVIAAAGGSQFELQACGCPSLLMVVADNQLNATQQAVMQSWCNLHDCRDIQTQTATMQLVDALICETFKLWSDTAKLTQWHRNALNTADTNGAARVVDTIFKALREA